MPFKKIKKLNKLPEKYPSVRRTLATVTSESKTVVGDFELRHKVDYIPQIGLQENVCASECNLIFMCGQGTAGKAQPYDANVLTPKGFVKMGRLKVGDVISDAFGGVQRVLKIYEQGIIEVYKVTFEDGASTECCKDHLWEVFKNCKKGVISRSYLMTLEQMLCKFKENYTLSTRVAKHVEFKDVKTETEPYTFGTKINECQEIPKAFKYNSIEKRILLMKGIVDTFGKINSKRNIELKVDNEQVAKDIQWIVRSLGGLCFIKKHVFEYTHKWRKDFSREYYDIEIISDFNTSLTTKEENKMNLRTLFLGKRYKEKDVLKRKIVSIEPVGLKRCRCLRVSGEEHLYVTDDFIVTHNTFSMYLKALNGIDKKDFKARLISVRALDSKKGSSMYADGVKVCGDFAGCQCMSSDIPTFYWENTNSTLQLIHSNFNYANKDERKMFEDYAKKQQASLIMIDEATEMNHFGMFLFWFMRNRDDSGMKPQMILSFNPLHEHWTTEMLKDAGFLGEDWFLKKDMIGKVRYFYVKGDTTAEIIWGDSRKDVVERAGVSISDEDRKAGLTEEDMIKSFTVFTGTAADNRELVNATGGQSVANLHAVGGTQRSIVGEAYFGPVEKETNNVSRKMVHMLWENPENDDENMYATMDIASGNEDSAPLIIWRGLTMVGIEYFEGEPTELESWIRARLERFRVPITNFIYDSTGHGYWVQGMTNGIGVTSNRRTVQEYDEFGNPTSTHLEFFNLRSQLLGKLEVMMKKGEISCEIPKDMLVPYKKGQMVKFFDVLCDGVDIFKTTTRNKKVYYRSKEEFKERFKYSPGEMDAIILRMYAELDTRKRKQPKAVIEDDAYDELYERPSFYQRRF